MKYDNDRRHREDSFGERGDNTMNRRRHHINLSGGDGGGQQHRPLAHSQHSQQPHRQSTRSDAPSHLPVQYRGCDHGYGHDDNNINTHTNTTSMEQGNRAAAATAGASSRRIFQEDDVGVGRNNAMGVMMVRHGDKMGCDSNEDYDPNNCGGGGRKEDRLEAVAVHQHHQPWRHSQQPDPPRPGIRPGILFGKTTTASFPSFRSIATTAASSSSTSSSSVSYKTSFNGLATASVSADAKAISATTQFTMKRGGFGSTARWDEEGGGQREDASNNFAAAAVSAAAAAAAAASSMAFSNHHARQNASAPPQKKKTKAGFLTSSSPFHCDDDNDDDDDGYEDSTDEDDRINWFGRKADASASMAAASAATSSSTAAAMAATSDKDDDDDDDNNHVKGGGDDEQDLHNEIGKREEEEPLVGGVIKWIGIEDDEYNSFEGEAVVSTNVDEENDDNDSIDPILVDDYDEPDGKLAFCCQNCT